MKRAQIICGLLSLAFLLLFAIFSTPALAQGSGFNDVFREFYRSRSMSKAYPPASLQPPAYSAELWNAGIRPDLAAADAQVPEWAKAEALGRQVQDKYVSSGALTGQIGGTWQDYVISVTRGPGDQLLARMIVARGPLPLRDQVKWIARGARNFPNEMDRLIDALPASVVPGQAGNDSYARGLADAIAAVERLRK